MQVRNCQTLKDPKRTYKRNGGQIMTYDLNITFDDNLVTGNETIDTQHKECGDIASILEDKAGTPAVAMAADIWRIGGWRC